MPILACFFKIIVTLKGVQWYFIFHHGFDLHFPNKLISLTFRMNLHQLSSCINQWLWWVWDTSRNTRIKSFLLASPLSLVMADFTLTESLFKSFLFNLNIIEIKFNLVKNLLLKIFKNQSWNLKTKEFNAFSKYSLNS